MGHRILLVGFATAVAALVCPVVALSGEPGVLTIDYPAEGSVFPPEISAPLFLWRDSIATNSTWLITLGFSDGSAAIQVKSPGERLRIETIDPRCVSSTNRLPKLTAQEEAARSWRPDPETWSAIKKHSVEHPATVTITGFASDNPGRAVSQGYTRIVTSKDAVDAPIFYRDVPLMPSELEKGVVKPLPQSALPLVAWRLRYVGESDSRLLLENLPTCANCHSFSRDGKTLGMDVDGPENDKGTYAIVPVAPQVSIHNADVMTWNAFADKPAGRSTIGFLSQISPDGRYAVTTLNEEVYVANFMDYRFLQVFYPTRGILAWYSRATGQIHALPGADDPRYVQTDSAWSPDGKYLVFSRAEARDSYPKGRPPAAYPNDPNEVPIQYDLYRIPFNEGKGGRPEPIAGASRNGMSNTFPKVSPDGRWIVFVQCRNGQLMRPDSELFIVPADGGRARRLRSNTSLMNSWHSFSPNGRWLVFSSKSRSPYTQMFLTHLDENGNDSPPVLIEKATAANRAVNIPEFVNIRPDGLAKIDVPAADFYRLFDHALELAAKGQYGEAVAEWNKALEIDPRDAKAHNNLGVAQVKEGNIEEALRQFQKAIELKPNFAQAHYNLGGVLERDGKTDEAIAHWRTALEVNSRYAEVHNVLGNALVREGLTGEAIAHFRSALAIDPGYAEARNNLGAALLREGRTGEAITYFREALAGSPQYAPAHYNLGVALAQVGKLDAAVLEFESALKINSTYVEAHYSLGRALYMRGEIPAALAEWHAALRVEPDYVPALRHVSWVLATCPDASVRNGAQAVEFAERALRRTAGGEPEVLDALAAAYAEAGLYRQAIETVRRALAVATKEKQRTLTEGLKIRLALYEHETPFREAR